MALPSSGFDTFYDNKTHSDIIVQFGDHRVFSHKVILAARSLYFRRAFQSQFAVATNAVIDLGNDDDPELVRIMLRLIYDDFSRIHIWAGIQDGKPFEDLGNFHINLFTLCDKYDVPLLRSLLNASFLTWADSQIGLMPHFTSEATKSNEEKARGLLSTLPNLLGPHAVEFVDKSLQKDAFDFCVKNLAELFKMDGFKAALEGGRLFDSHFAGKLIAYIGPPPTPASSTDQPKLFNFRQSLPPSHLL